MDWCSVFSLMERLLDIVLFVAGAVAVIYILIGAYHYFTAFGNEEKATQAKKTLMWAIIGAIVIMSSILIVDEVTNLLMGNTTNQIRRNSGLQGTTNSNTTNPSNSPVTIPSGPASCPTYEAAENLFKTKQASYGNSSDWDNYISKGPCLPGTVKGGWAVDIETGDEKIDNDPSNQCPAANKWVALDIDGNFSGQSANSDVFSDCSSTSSSNNSKVSSGDYQKQAEDLFNQYKNNANMVNGPCLGQIGGTGVYVDVETGDPAIDNNPVNKCYNYKLCIIVDSTGNYEGVKVDSILKDLKLF